jgi:hypothetical protein
VSDSDFLKLVKGCTIDENGEITETEDYQNNLIKQNELKVEQAIKDNYKQYKIDSIILELIKEIYLALPTTTKDKISQEAINKFNTLKSFLDNETNSN